MSIRKLITMTDYVNEILAYTHESKNYERGNDLLEWYSELLARPIDLEMFKSNNPLFPNFNIVESQKQATLSRHSQSIHPFGDNEFAITLYRESKHSSSENGMCYITSYHLKTIEDLCGKDITYSLKSELLDTELFESP